MTGYSIGESVSASAFIAEVRKLKDKALRDRIVGGINHEATQKKLLLSESKLTYTKAIETAQGDGTSDTEMQTPLKPTVKTEPVHQS